jgi:hypothetical protein
MNMKKTLFAVLTSCFAFNAIAAVHTYEFEAAVSMIGDVDALRYLQSTAGQLPGTSLTIGDRVAGRFSIDTETPMNWWIYGGSKQNSLTFTDLPSAYANTPSQAVFLMIRDDGNRRYLTINAGDFKLNLFDNSKTVLSLYALPDHLSLNNLVASINSDFSRSTDGHYMLTSSTLTSLKEVSLVPEAETYAMLLAGLIVVLTVSRRTRAVRS